MELRDDDPVAVAVVDAIHDGDLGALGSLLAAHRELAGARIRDAKAGTRSLLHAVTDWPGYFPRGPEVVHVLIDAGADPNAAVTGSWHAETPLHWAASSDDADVAAALIDGGADIRDCGTHARRFTPESGRHRPRRSLTGACLIRRLDGLKCRRVADRG